MKYVHGIRSIWDRRLWWRYGARLYKYGVVNTTNRQMYNNKRKQKDSHKASNSTKSGRTLVIWLASAYHGPPSYSIVPVAIE